MSYDLDKLLGRAGLGPVTTAESRSPRILGGDSRARRVSVRDVACMQGIQDEMVVLHDDIALAQRELGTLSDRKDVAAKSREISQLRMKLSAEIESLRRFG